MKIIVHGAGGHMGRIVTRLVNESAVHELSAEVDRFADGMPDTVAEVETSADMVIDFSNHLGTVALLNDCVSKKLPLVLATTGHTDEEKSAIAEAAKQIPVFYSANMSPAITMLADMARQAAALFPDADIEIVEKHHHRKLDVPSGTALIFAKAVQEAREDAPILIGRHENGRRGKEIAVHSLRIGNEVGTHEVIIATGNETITLKHEAEDRALFAEGALRAAEFLLGQEAGLYSMKDYIGRK